MRPRSSSSFDSSCASSFGYQIVSQHADDKLDRRGQQQIDEIIGLRVPKEVVEQKCALYMRGGKPAQRAELLGESDYGILTKYQATAMDAANRQGIRSQGRLRLRPGEPDAGKPACPVREGVSYSVLTCASFSSAIQKSRSAHVAQAIRVLAVAALPTPIALLGSPIAISRSNGAAGWSALPVATAPTGITARRSTSLALSSPICWGKVVDLYGVRNAGQPRSP